MFYIAVINFTSAFDDVVESTISTVVKLVFFHLFVLQ